MKKTGGPNRGLSKNLGGHGPPLESPLPLAHQNRPQGSDSALIENHRSIAFTLNPIYRTNSLSNVEVETGAVEPLLNLTNSGIDATDNLCQLTYSIC